MSKLRQLRTKRNVSVAELAGYLRVSARYIAFIEAGKREPSLGLAKRIAGFFDVPIEEVF
ncbi:MAG: helix-turn-helix transcriptional regulator [Peptococcaceae bacterium]|nr:helix-turn-helix transcriptional regulator [Peptococcaceae bacterium]